VRLAAFANTRLADDRKTAQIKAIPMESFHLPATAPLQRGFLLTQRAER
jgi:hypothetical protein